MPEGNEGGGRKILGMPRKVAIPVLAVGAVVVVYFLLVRSRQGGAIPRMAPEDSGGGGGFGGGGGGGISPTLGGIITSTPVNPWEEAQERLTFERDQFEYNIRQRQEDERQREFEIAFEERRSTLDRFLELLPFQLQTEKEKEASEAAGYRAEAARSEAESAFFQTERIAQERFAEASGKAPIKCPPGMHPANVPGEGFTCRTLGDPGGGRGFNPIRQIGQVIGGFVQGIAAAAPGIGYGAANAGAQYGLAQAGFIPGTTGGRVSRKPSRQEYGQVSNRGTTFEPQLTGEQWTNF